MAKDKKENKSNIETKEITIDLNQLATENEKFINDVAEFLQEKIDNLNTVRNGDSLVLTVEQNMSRRKIKDFLKKFLYLANLNDYRPIALTKDKKGYEIHKKKET